MADIQTSDQSTHGILIVTVDEEGGEQQRSFHWWARMLAYTAFVMVGESSETMLAGLYFNGGGCNILLAAALETLAFPILLPISIYCSSQTSSSSSSGSSSNNKAMAAIYILLGLFQAAYSILYAIGLQQLPVSIFSLICATQLGFNALFAFFLNSQKLTPPTLNALFLLTISSVLLIFQPSHGEPQAGNLVLGFSSTLAASTLYALSLSLTQLFFKNIIKKENLCSVLNMTIFQSLVATCALLVPLSGPGQWRAVMREMESFRYGRGGYICVVAMMAVASQLHSIGSVGLILEVSSLFSNVVATVGLPIVPVLGALFFHESMDGVKVISILLAIWGFASYIYQHYSGDEQNFSKQIRPCSLLQHELP